VLLAAVIRTTMYGGTGTDGVRASSFFVSGRLVIMGLLCTVYTLIGIRGMLCIVSFLHVLEAIIIDVTSVAAIGDIRFTECQPIRHIHVKIDVHCFSQSKRDVFNRD